MPGADEGMADSPTLLLVEILAEARAAGFLGPGPSNPSPPRRGFRRHRRRLAAPARPGPASSTWARAAACPGLVVAISWPEATWSCSRPSARRAAFLERAVERLGLGDRVRVLHERAEVCGRQAGFRGGFDGALARSFGRPAVVAECAAPLLEVGGWLVVSEPPQSGRRRTPTGRPAGRPSRSRRLGLEPGEAVHEEFEYRVLRQVSACPERFPRRNGVPAKRPLF